MDRRSWLWRRKSSEKSPSGETESSGSVSSHSERFSDDQALSNHNSQSPEVTSKSAQGDEIDDTVKKSLSQKLSEALVNISAKEDLVKQHAKVAEEAVSGWERAENEVLALKKQNDTLTKKNSTLEERVEHLDGALKECLRQLRQAREEQEDKIQDAITNKTFEWESNKSQLENQLTELQTQLHLAKTDTNDDAILLIEIRSKLEASEKENSILKLKLLSKAKEVELSTRAAETASKQHLDSIKRVAKLESECRRLKAMARKATLANDQRSVTASSIYVESFTDSQSDNGDRILAIENDSFITSGESHDSETGQFKHERALGKSLFCPSVEIDLMDDFLEMERLAAIPETHSKRISGERVDELKENLRKVTAEKADLEVALNECQIQLNASEDQLSQTMAKLVDLKMQLAVADEAKRDAEKEIESMKLKLKKSTILLDEAELTIIQTQDKLAKVNEAKTTVEAKLEDANLKKAEAESRIKVMENELENLRSTNFALEKEDEKQKSFSQEAARKCDELEAEISRMKSDSRFQRSAIVEEFRINQDKELEVAASKFAECQKTIASLDRQLKSLATLEDFMIDSEIPIDVL